MNIKYLGHACFMMISDTGTTIVTDPYDFTVGYNMPQINADIVTVSHQHYDHNYTKAIDNECTVISQIGEYEFKGIKITGIHTFHDDVNGHKRGNNIVFKILIDGIDICHCGDLGHTLEQKQIDAIGHVDILMIPVGGTYTVDAKEAAIIVEQLKPQMVIPMHYKTPEINFDISGVDEFINVTGNGEWINRNQMQITKGNIEHFRGVKVLNYK